MNNYIKFSFRYVLSTSLLFLCLNPTYSQISEGITVREGLNFIMAKDYSKEVSLYRSKQFLFETVLHIDSEVLKYEIIPLAASSSGELTTLIYTCEKKKREGIVLCFYGDFWTPERVLYQGYAFKNLDAEKAMEFLAKLDAAVDSNTKYLRDDSESNNVAFTYDDIGVLVSTNNMGTIEIRLFWQGFDATWGRGAFERSKRRFEKRMTK